MINGYQSNILKIYEEARNKEAEKLKLRKEEIENKIPQVAAIEKHIGKLSIELSINILKGVENIGPYIANVKEKITDLQMKRSELLVEHGYPLNYLSMHYQCKKCEDTGFIGTERCSCYKQKLVELHYITSGLKEVLAENNFDNFNLDFYSSKRIGNEQDPPRKNIEKIVSKSMYFINNFNSLNENLLFYGNSGTGKTFLSYCITKELLDKGFLVVYRTADDLIQNLKSIRFNNDSTLEELILDCDLLIIDDLGTESISEFSKSELFNLINKKLLKNRKMIISTNHTLEGISKTYSERITSRLFGNFTLCKFYGEDIRVRKNLAKMKNQLL